MQHVIELGFHSSAVKGGQTQCATVLRGHPLEVEVCERKVLSGFRAPALIDCATRSVKKLVVEPLATVDLGLCSAAVHDVSYDSLFTPLWVLKPWLVRPARESDCKVTKCGSHVKRVVTWGDGAEEKDFMTHSEEKSEVIFVAEGRDVERVTAILKNPHRCKIYQRDARDKLRAEIDVRCQTRDASNGEARDGN